MLSPLSPHPGPPYPTALKMRWVLVGCLGAVAVGVLLAQGCVEVALRGRQSQCEALGRDTELPVRFSRETGCLVQVGGRWIPQAAWLRRGADR